MIVVNINQRIEISRVGKVVLVRAGAAFFIVTKEGKRSFVVERSGVFPYKYLSLRTAIFSNLERLYV